MGRALIVSAGTNSNEYLARHIAALGFPRPVIAASGSEARRLLSGGGFDVVIVNAPLPDEYGHELGSFAVQNSLAGVLLLAKSGTAEQLADRVEEYGVLVLSKPFGQAQFYQAVRMAKACNRRLQLLEQKNDQLQERLAQLRLVDQAKCFLIEKKGWTEADAHRLIEKQAMDCRCTRGEIARRILDGTLPLPDTAPCFTE